jgi:hypothetical protein
MTKLEFLPEPYMMFRLENFHSYMLLAFALSLVIPEPYERFVMLL